MKRFWTDVTTEAAEGGWSIRLDGRPVQTPARALLVLPTTGLADAIAGEWQAVGADIDPRAMPLTGLANAAVDKVAPDRQAFANGLARYAEADLACYRAEWPPELVEQQAAGWDPLLAWARRRYDVDFATTTGLMHVAQPPATVERLVHEVTALGPRRSKFRTRRHEHQDRCGRYLTEDEIDELTRGRVSPMKIFDDEEKRLLRGERQKQIHDGLECLLLLALRCEVQGGVEVGNRNGQERGPERHRFGLGQTISGESCLDLRDPLGWRVISIEVELALEEVDQRKEGAVLVVGRAATFPPGVSLRRDAILQDPTQP